MNESFANYVCSEHQYFTQYTELAGAVTESPAHFTSTATRSTQRTCACGRTLQGLGDECLVCEQNAEFAAGLVADITRMETAHSLQDPAAEANDHQSLILPEQTPASPDITLEQVYLKTKKFNSMLNAIHTCFPFISSI
jgi:hypothetical protein